METKIVNININLPAETWAKFKTLSRDTLRRSTRAQIAYLIETFVKTYEKGGENVVIPDAEDFEEEDTLTPEDLD